MMVTLLVLLVGCSSAPPVTASAGELSIVQLDLPATSLGEAALIVGPDGTTVLIDVGNGSHVDDIFDALGGEAVDWVGLTHFHGDHIGAMPRLLQRGLEVRRGIVHRGFVDLTDDTNAGDTGALCQHLRDAKWSKLDVPLCV